MVIVALTAAILHGRCFAACQTGMAEREPSHHCHKSAPEKPSTPCPHIAQVDRAPADLAPELVPALLAGPAANGAMAAVEPLATVIVPPPESIALVLRI